MRTGIPFASLGLVIFLSVSLQAQPLPDPLLYFPFDTGSGDFTGNGNFGELLGGALISPGGTGHSGDASDGALNLGNHNNGAYVSVPSAAEGAFGSLVENDAVTISTWFFGNDQQPQNNWNFRAGGPTVDRVLGSHAPWSNSNIYFDVAGCCNPDQRINAVATEEDIQGQWNHFAYLKDGPLTAIYINGALFLESAPENVMLPLSEIDQFVVGADFGGLGSYGGMIDDFAMFDVALSSEQIASIADGAEIPSISVGDFDESGSIDEDDFRVLAENLGAHLRRTVLHSDGDFDLNGQVNLHDFRQFKSAFPAAFAAATGVPEPATIVMLVAAIGAMLPLLRRPSRLR